MINYDVFIRNMKEEELKKEGWVRAFTAEGARLWEAVELYKEIGYEVKIVSYKEINWEGCEECFVGNDVKVIYIRRKVN